MTCDQGVQEALLWRPDQIVLVDADGLHGWLWHAGLTVPLRTRPGGRKRVLGRYVDDRVIILENYAESGVDGGEMCRNAIRRTNEGWKACGASTLKALEVEGV